MGGVGGFFFNKGFLHPRDTYLPDRGREEEEEEVEKWGEGEGEKRKN